MDPSAPLAALATAEAWPDASLGPVLGLLLWLVLHYGLYRLLRSNRRPALKARLSRLALALSMLILVCAAYSVDWMPWLPQSRQAANSAFGGLGVVAVNGAAFLLAAMLGIVVVRALVRWRGTSARGKGQ